MVANFEAMMENTDDYIYFKDRTIVFTARQADHGVFPAILTSTGPNCIGKTDYDLLPEEFADTFYQAGKSWPSPRIERSRRSAQC